MQLEGANFNQYLSVPRDYFNSSAGTASVAIARIKAKKSPSKGSYVLWLLSSKVADLSGYQHYAKSW